MKIIITESHFMYIKEDLHKDYLKWKRKNVTIRGMQDMGKENGGMGRFGRGLYTAFLGNRDMAKEYGKVYFVVNAVPKHPKVFNYANDAEIFIQNMINNWCKRNNSNYNPNLFYEKTNIPDEMLSLGYDGLVVKGREMVNYTPNMDEIKFFENEHQLKRYYDDKFNNKSL